MKHILNNLMTGAACLLAACSGQAPTVLTGTIAHSPSEVAVLMHGEENDTIAIDDDGSFRFEKQMPEADFYTFMIPGVRLYQSVWMENGKRNELIVDAESPDQVSLKGDSEKEAAFMEQEMVKVYTREIPESNSFKAYVQEWEKFAKTMVANSKSVGNDAFTKYVQRYMTQYIQGHKHHYMEVLTKNNQPMDSDSEFNAYMQSIDVNDVANMNDNQTFYYLMWKSRCRPDVPKLNYYAMMQVAAEEVTNQEVRDEYGFRLLRMYLTSTPVNPQTKEVYKLAMSLTKPETQKQVTEFYNNTVRPVGSEIPDFDMLTPDNKTVRFHQVCDKKVVYIDVWSTWCGPCCKEIPFVAKLVEHYKGHPDMKFISISLDKNLGDWRKFLDGHAPQWEQYVIPKEEQKAFLKRFAINGIPRFMVFDERCRVVNLNADRPSSPNMIPYLDNLLEKKSK